MKTEPDPSTRNENRAGSDSNGMPDMESWTPGPGRLHVFPLACSIRKCGGGGGDDDDDDDDDDESRAGSE